MASSNAANLASFLSGDTLTVNNSNDRVGIASTQPTSALFVVGDATVSGNATVGGIITATSFVGSGANLTNVISGVELKQSGSSVGTSITAINFSGASVTAPVAGLSTVTVSVPTQLTIGTRTGAAVTSTLTGSSFNVINRAGGNVTINI